MSNLAVVQGDVSPFIPDERIAFIKRQVFPNATDLELEAFINLARTKRLDPLTNQIYAIKYKANEKAQMFASIDGLRVIAERTGKYLGQTAPLWCGPDLRWRELWLDKTPPSGAKVGVWKAGAVEPTWGVASFKSYGLDRWGEPKKNNWLSMPDVMLAKCAESIALRKAFPDDISGLYIREEFSESQEPLSPTRASEAVESRPAAVSEVVPGTPARALGSAVLSSEVVVDPETGEIETVESVRADIAALVARHELTDADLRFMGGELGLTTPKHRTVDDLRRLRAEIVRRTEQPALAIEAAYAVAGEAGDDGHTR